MVGGGIIDAKGAAEADLAPVLLVLVFARNANAVAVFRMAGDVGTQDENHVDSCGSPLCGERRR